MVSRLSVLKRASRTGVLARCTALAALPVGLAFAAPARPGTVSAAAKAHPTGRELRGMTRAVPPGQRLCYAETAWISGADGHYGVLVTQASCGGSVYVHEWLRRKSLTASAPWRVVAQRSGTIDQPAGCTRSASVPSDIRCL